jgi:methylmalonyl-CoA mutase C-terminal domain/subunit
VGGIIPRPDIPKLKQMGVAEVFIPGTPIKTIVQFIRSMVGGGG